MVGSTRRYAALFAAGVLFATLGSCSSDSGGVGVTEADYSITVDGDSAPAGDVTFDIQNDAGQIHEFVVFQTDLAPDALPVDDAGDVGGQVGIADQAASRKYWPVMSSNTS